MLATKVSRRENKTKICLNQKTLFFAFIAAVVACNNPELSGAVFEKIGLVPSPYSLSRCEAITASTGDNTSGIFYNPASLAFQSVSLGIAGIEGSVDDQSSQSAASLKEDEDALEAAYRRVGAEKPIFAEVITRLPELSLPFFSLASFVRVSLQSESPSEARNTANYSTEFQADLGAIAGIGIRYGGFALGYSSYVLRRAQLLSTPSPDQMTAAQEAITTKSFSENTLPFRDFTAVNSGGTAADNIGIMYRPFEDNISALAIAILNVGGAKFSSKLPLNNKNYEKIEAQILEAANTYQVSTKTPESIPEIISAGINLGVGGGNQDFAKLELSIDHNDIDGNLIENKTAVSAEAGLALPDPIAMASAFQIAVIEDKIVHMGLKKITATAGIRPGSYQSTGATLGFHFGLDYRFSFITLDLTGYQTTVTNLDEPMSISGLKADIGLTLIF